MFNIVYNFMRTAAYQTRVPQQGVLKKQKLLSCTGANVLGFFFTKKGQGRVVARREGHTVSHPGYLPDCVVDIHAVFY